LHGAASGAPAPRIVAPAAHPRPAPPHRSNETLRRKPPIYKVMLHNDNYNRREYVVKTLLKVVEQITVDDAVNAMQVGRPCPVVPAARGVHQPPPQQRQQGAAAQACQCSSSTARTSTAAASCGSQLGAVDSGEGRAAARVPDCDAARPHPQEAHETGVALVVACAQDQAEGYVENLRLNGLVSTMEPGN
jgi:ATP-dependent Clp protease adapter protein ClpS